MISNKPSREFNEFKNGFPGALDFYFKKFHDVIFWEIFIKCKDETIAYHVANAAFEALWNKRNSITNEEQICSWLFDKAEKELRSMCEDYRKGKEGEKEYVSLAEVTTVQDSDEEEKENGFVRLWTAMKRLSPRRYAVLYMHIVEGKSIKEIAAELDIAEQTVRNHLARAKISLRKDLAGVAFLVVYTVSFCASLMADGTSHINSEKKSLCWKIKTLSPN